MNLPKADIRLQGLCRATPVRKYEYGPLPIMSESEVVGQEKEQEEIKCVFLRGYTITKQEERGLIAAAQDISIRACFS